MPRSTERSLSPISGWWGLIGSLGLASIGAYAAWVAAGAHSAPMMAAGLLTLAVGLLGLKGLMLVQPNHAVVLVLFGRYRGTVRRDGFFWVHPLSVGHHLSLRARNMASDTIKVNDLVGNPVEIGVVTVWEVRDTAQATFDVDQLVSYVDVQIEAAVRAAAKEHPYDSADPDVVSLRSDTSVVADQLLASLQERLDRAGVNVLEARITHLAYAPEIAGAMLQRQQASAIVAARKEIVEGAVGMVEQALHDLSDREVVVLSPTERSRLVSNLLVVLCGQSAAQPVVQAGP
jgi:regulator of protease activity HflC (stomatin/prohibitin superfamily)